jgi:predicted RNase H-like HicB family nuclease
VRPPRLNCCDSIADWSPAALGGLTTQGETLEEARAMVKDAVLGYLEALEKAGEEIPVEHGPAQVEKVAVTL